MSLDVIDPPLLSSLQSFPVAGPPRSFVPEEGSSPNACSDPAQRFAPHNLSSDVPLIEDAGAPPIVEDRPGFQTAPGATTSSQHAIQGRNEKKATDATRRELGGAGGPGLRGTQGGDAHGMWYAQGPESHADSILPL